MFKWLKVATNKTCPVQIATEDRSLVHKLDRLRSSSVPGQVCNMLPRVYQSVPYGSQSWYPHSTKWVKGYKVVDHKSCGRNQFRYKANTDYKMDGKPELCERGFHFCFHPLDCFRYVHPSYTDFRMYRVEAPLNAIHTDGFKAAASHIEIKDEIDLLSPEGKAMTTGTDYGRTHIDGLPLADTYENGKLVKRSVCNKRLGDRIDISYGYEKRTDKLIIVKDQCFRSGQLVSEIVQVWRKDKNAWIVGSKRMFDPHSSEWETPTFVWPN